MSGRANHILASSIAFLSLWPGVSVAIDGRVVDLNGRPLQQAMVTVAKEAGQAGPTAVTVFTDDSGRFRFPSDAHGGAPSVRALGYRMIDVGVDSRSQATGVTILMRADSNQAGIAPASAWLGRISDPNDRVQLVMTCVACHQMPAPEVRTFARMIRDVPGADEESARQQSWHAIVQYMNYLSAWEFGRGAGGGAPDPARVYSGGDADPTTVLLARSMTGSFQELAGYSRGAPLAVDARTVIREYEIPRPNAVREAVTLADPGTIWAADVSANRVIRVDATTGAQRDYPIPSERLMGPHTLVRGRDGSLWVAPFFNGIVARLDPATEQWKTWQLSTGSGGPVGVHDLTFDAHQDLMTDRRGRIWFSDIVNNAVGWLDPASGRSGIYPVPAVPGRTGRELLYGIVMTSDRRHVWYSQLGIGCFGSFNTETLEFETVVQLPDGNSGPRRVAVSDRDILYVPLYGSGQLVEYDTRARKMIGVYDLPDRASAPYATTWDPKRKVVWIPTSNADAIYRFDPRNRSFAVLPLPREGAFLRMLEVDRQTGSLVTSYANILENVHGPRMVVKIDVADSGGAEPRTAAAEAGLP
ncbi:MAG TPA: carboxypeptidase regulatory-like domain-containing protein [Steroidobacteraceae bacterium]|nr:carboxypeptidase regulatory-like domain-containing protein [Steroidobacteraceae bacterium]